jgi:hypothetical protein
MAAKYDHVHKYKRVMLGDFAVYRCMLLGCTHWLRAEFVAGKLSRCWGRVLGKNDRMMDCEHSLEITEAMISNKVVKPKCMVCKEIKRKRLEMERSIPTIIEKEENEEHVG